ncbi:serine/threonine-protein kinase [Streptomyces sp. NPDC049099]|uniref:serine/threonine-protein kinase n=1 Tax=Streptomyces sp. NPDC049099 TaxID=3155768 RepID=UPI00342339CB
MHDGESDERRVPAVEEPSGDRWGADSFAGFDRLGHYVLCEVLGEGGMGQVYRAYDLNQDREVALKILSPQARLDQQFCQRFQRESRIVARLNEPHIIPIHHYGEIDGRLYLDMRLVEGEDLRSRLRDRGPLTLRETTDILAQVADALDAAHEATVTHRDVKPSNILLSQGHSGTPFVYLADFGIARSGGGTTLTGPTQAVGTAEYMAPERFLGTGTDRRIDVYSLACVLYECLAGRTPFPGQEFAAQCHAHIELPPPRVSEAVPGLPAELDDIIARGMAKQPERRYPTAGDLVRHLRRVTDATTTAQGDGTDGKSPVRRFLKLRPSRKALLIVVAVIVVLCVGLAGLLVFGPRSSHSPAPPPTAPRVPSASPTPGPAAGTLSALFTTALPTADDTDEGFTPAERQLESSSHFVDHCHPMQSVENRHSAVLAAVHCSVVNGGSSGGPTVVNLYRFDSPNTLDQAIGALTARAGKGPCTGAGPVAQSWPTGSAVASGTLYCFTDHTDHTDRGRPALAWSDDRQVTLSVVSGSRMQTLYQWWSGHR